MDRIGVGHFYATDQHKANVMDVLNSHRLSYGPYSKKFENIFAELHGVKFAAFCNSGTSALQIAVATLKETEQWNEGDEILCPALTFVASSNVIIMNNMHPVFVDVEEEYYGIDPQKIEEKITPRTKAIMVVHLFGQSCDMDSIMNIATKYNLKIIEDSCETMYASYKGKPVGSFGDISCFSTYVAHLLVTGVGGFVCTNKPEYARLNKSLINHGRDNIYLSIDDDKGKSKEELKEIIKRRFKFIRLGYSYRATEMEAALGLAELERREMDLVNRKEQAEFLLRELSDLSEYLRLPKVREGATHSFMMFPIVLKNPNVTKENLVYFLEENGIETRDMLPLINQPFYIEKYGELESKYPITAHINKNGFYIGCHPGLTRENLAFIVSKFREFFAKN